MLIDCYGFESTSEFYLKRRMPDHLIRRVDGALYVKIACGGSIAALDCHGDLAPIHRIDRDPDGNLRVTWALGSLAAAETLAYVPLSQPLEIPKGS